MSHHFASLSHSAAQAPLLTCAVCSGPLTASDLAELGLRAPEPWETTDEYLDAELLDPDELCHLDCTAGAS